MKTQRRMVRFLAGVTLAAGTAFAGTAAALAATPGTANGQGQAIVTVLPKRAEQIPAIQMSDLQVKLNGKGSTVTDWRALRGPGDKLELVVLIDGSARTSLTQQFGDIGTFFQELAPGTRVAVATMENGRAVFTGPLTEDRSAAAAQLRIPAGAPGSNASPYFCLSDLAKQWPSSDKTARREVLMITDGVDNYERRLDLNDPYVEAAIRDSARSGLVVYAIYWQNKGRWSATDDAANAGQSLLNMVTDATGGYNYWSGNENPVSFQPFFKDLAVRLANQYRLSFDGVLEGKPDIRSMKLRVGGPEAKITAPHQVYLDRSGE